MINGLSRNIYECSLDISKGQKDAHCSIIDSPVIKDDTVTELQFDAINILINL